MKNISRLLKSDVSIDEKYHIFLESVRWLRKSEHDSSYSNILKKLCGLAQDILNLGGGDVFSDNIVRNYVECYNNFKEEKKKYQVYLIGSEQGCERGRMLLNYDKVHLLGCMQGIFAQIDQSDYCIICDSLEEAMQQNLAKLQHTYVVRYDLVHYFALEILPECQCLDMKFREKLNTGIEGVVLGLSYEQKLNYEKLKNNMVCFAASSHDLFLDYHKLTWLYREIQDKGCGKLKYCVLGMDFYRFWYDLSMSGYKARMMCMYHKLHCVHHFHEFDSVLPKYEDDLKVCEELMVDQYLDREYSNTYLQGAEEVETVYDPTKEEYQRDVVTIRDRVFHKPYPHTFQENIGILEKILKYAYKRDIRVLIYIPPFPAIFNEYTPDAMRQQTWSVLKGLQEICEFDILDLSQHTAFQKKHFGDCAHLNKDGADLATELLNSYMDEIWG